MGEGALLERALAQFMLDVHTREHGYKEVQPPILVNSASRFRTLAPQDQPQRTIAQSVRYNMARPPETEDRNACSYARLSPAELIDNRPVRFDRHGGDGCDRRALPARPNHGLSTARPHAI